MSDLRVSTQYLLPACILSTISCGSSIPCDPVFFAGDSPQEALAMFQPGPDWSGPPMAVLLNKADLLGEEQLAELAQWYKENCRAEQVSVALGLDSPRSVAPHNK